ncbi:type II toxin-antitoxin system RelE family toxin [Candidatus Nanohalococcus occultus]|uniref:type II toxin-antitoxin system RelE family toxin n=1 Tax=Candidatus Nanohalococcus occultus TaxID=2978047 RepID=UPI0039E02F89
MTYEVRLDLDAAEFLNSQDEKTQSIIKKNLSKLKDEPYPSPEAQSGDREKVTVNCEEVYRIHISRSHTAFYIFNEEDQVIVTDIVDIDTAHKMYD